LEQDSDDALPKGGKQSQGKWRWLGILVLVVTLICWGTAGSLTYAVAFHGVSPFWLPAAAIAGFSGEVSLVIGLSLLSFKLFKKRFEALQAFSSKLLKRKVQ
jgi:hypothetical protein